MNTFGKSLVEFVSKLHRNFALKQFAPCRPRLLTPEFESDLGGPNAIAITESGVYLEGGGERRGTVAVGRCSTFPYWRGLPPRRFHRTFPVLLKPDAHGPTAAWPWAFLADACTTRPFNSSLLCVPDAIN